MQPVAVPQVLSLTEDLQAAVLKNLGPGCLSDARLVCSHLRGLVDQQLVTGLQVQVPGREVCVWYWGGQGSGVCGIGVARVQVCVGQGSGVCGTATATATAAVADAVVGVVRVSRGAAQL